MRKISFGSFPLTEVKKEDRKCLDRYLIKSFADNISISDAIRNLSVTKDLMYITPDALMRDFAGIKKQNQPSRVVRGDRESNTLYESALKRAFHVLREFYSMVSISPFYKDYVYYPIYIEKVERISAEGSSDYDAKFTNVTMNYSFIVLSNDLTKSLKIDEIRYDENASLNFLFLFIEFFSGKGMDQSIHSFSQKDYEFLVQLYQFTEKSGKEPIQMVLDLYKIIGLLKKMNDSKFDDRDIIGEMNKFLDGTELDTLKRYKGLLRHKFVELIDKRDKQQVQIRQTFIDLLSTIFKSDGLSKLYDGVDTKASRGERYNYIYSSNKYREVLNLAKELVEYNKLGCNGVITEDSLEIDFRVENNNRTLDVKSGEAAQRYQTFFKDYVSSIRAYFEGMIRSLVSEIVTEDDLNGVTADLYREADDVLKDIRKEQGVIEKEKKELEGKIGQLSGDALKVAESELNDMINRLATVESNITFQDNYIKTLENQNDLKRTIKTINTDVVEQIVNHLLSSLATSLTFVYDDGKRFFTNQLVAQGLINLSLPQSAKSRPKETPTGCDLTTIDGFPKAAKESSIEGTFPRYIKDDRGVNQDNPDYFAAGVASALEDAFTIMASDTMLTFEDHVIPILQKELQRNITLKTTKDRYAPHVNKNKTGGAGGVKNLFQPKDAEIKGSIRERVIYELITKMESKDLSSNPKFIEFQETLHVKVFRNRFITNVLRHFLRLFDVREVTQVIEHDKKVAQLHPLIRKLLKDGSNCQFFKSFIIEHEMIEQLYRLKYITDTQKFLDGIDDVPPRKFNDPMNRMQTVLHDYLGLKRNPTWVVSKTNVYLSMPDDLSLTNSGILSNIPKVDLMDVCRIDPRDYWNGEKMGEVAKFGNPKIQKLTNDIDIKRKEIETIQKRISDREAPSSYTESVIIQINDNLINREILEEAKKGRNNNKNKKKKNNNNNNGSKDPNKNDQKSIENIQKQIDKKEEEIQKAMADWEEKDYLPNMSIFDDPYRAEKQEFISDKERSELIGNRDEMGDKLRELNPYDEEDVREMEANQRGIDSYRDEQEKEQRSHPFDFEGPGRDGRPQEPQGTQGPQRFNGYSSREEENEDWVRNGERSDRNEFADGQDQHGYDNRDRWKR